MGSTQKFQITKEFIQHVVCGPVNSFEVAPRSNGTENFSSTLQTVQVKLELKGQIVPMHLIIKTLPVEAVRCAFVQKHHLFSKEFLVYEKWIPELNRMVDELMPMSNNNSYCLHFINTPIFEGGSVSCEYSALLSEPGPDMKTKRLYTAYYEDGRIFKEDFLAMVDMQKTFDYRLSSNLLDYEHCCLVMVTLAKFHALSWVYKVKNGLTKLTDKYPYMTDFLHAEPLIDNLSDQIRPIVKFSLEIVKNHFGEESGIFHRAKNLLGLDHFKLLKLFLGKDGIKEVEIDSLVNLKSGGQHPIEEKADPSWLVGCHGDCWRNNLLFKYRDGIPKEVVLLDFQLFQEACPTTDLAYFFFTSTSALIRMNHTDDLLRIYQESFTGICEALQTPGLPNFNLENLKSRYQRSKFYGFTLFLILFSLHAPNLGDPLNKGKGVFSGKANDWGTRLLGIVEELFPET